VVPAGQRRQAPPQTPSSSCGSRSRPSQSRPTARRRRSRKTTWRGSRWPFGRPGSTPPTSSRASGAWRSYGPPWSTAASRSRRSSTKASAHSSSLLACSCATLWNRLLRLALLPRQEQLALPGPGACGHRPPVLEDRVALEPRPLLSVAHIAHLLFLTFVPAFPTCLERWE
jgi:hypothetical protein